MLLNDNILYLAKQSNRNFDMRYKNDFNFIFHMVNYVLDVEVEEVKMDSICKRKQILYTEGLEKSSEFYFKTGAFMPCLYLCIYTTLL